MAITIPTLDRAPVENQQPSVGRIDFKPVDTNQAEAVQTAAADKLVSEGAKFYQEEKDRAGRLAGLAVENELTNEYNTGLEGKYDRASNTFTPGLKHLKGDPVPDIQNFEQRIADKKAEIISRYADKDSGTLEYVKGAINNVDRKLNEKKITIYSTRDATYTTQVTNSGVKLAQNGMIDATAHMDRNDPDATITLDQRIGDIQNLRLQEGLKNHTVKEILDPKGEIDPLTGKVKVIGYDSSPTVKMQIAKDISDGLSTTIQNLTSAGMPDDAKFLIDKYKDHLDQAIKPQIVEKTLKEEKNQQALGIASTLRYKSPEDAQSEAMKIDDPVIRDKVMAEIATNTRRLDQAKASQNKDNYNQAGKIIQERMRGPSPFHDVNDMYNDPQVKAWIDKVNDPKKVTALEHMVVQPTDSNPQALSKAYESLQKGEFQGMSFDDFNEKIAGLNKKDRTSMTNVWNKANSQTNAEGYRMNARMSTQVEQEMQNAGLVTIQRFGRKYTQDDQVAINQAKNDLIAQMELAPPKLDQASQNEYVKKFISDKIKNKAFEPPPETLKFQGTIKPPAPPPKGPDTSNVPGVKPQVDDLETLKSAQRIFKQVKGVYPTSTDELKAFIKNGYK
jgi:hypothetical protein